MDDMEARRRALGQRLKDRRESKKLTQTQVGSHFGVDKGTVSAWEKGRGIPDALRLADLARIYGVPADALLGEGAARQFSPEVTELASAIDALPNGERSRAMRLCWELVHLLKGELANSPKQEVPVVTQRRAG